MIEKGVTYVNIPVHHCRCRSSEQILLRDIDRSRRPSEKEKKVEKQEVKLALLR